MIFNILDRQFNTLTSMDNSIRGAIHFFDDEFHRYLQQGLSTFDFSVLRNNEDMKYFVEGNYIQFEYKSRDYLLTIRRIEEDETKLTIFTEDLNFDLLNEYVPAYTAPKARPIADYLNDIIANSHVVIGINEVRSYSRTLSWDGEATVLERLMSIVKQFDAEHEFVTVLNDDRSLDHIVLNIYHKRDDKYQGVGVDRTDTELRFGENVNTVRRTTDITELFTCIRPIGTDGLTIKDKAETIKDENGNVLYFTNKGSEYIFAPKANQLFGRPELGNKGYIAMPYSFDTKIVNTLYGNALAELKKFSEPAVTYEVEGYYDLNIGDVVSIADNKYNPVLLLEARVAEMVISFTSPEQNKTVFSNYRVFESQISSDLINQMKELKKDVEYAKQVANTPILKISSNGSTVFKNGAGSVELMAAVERANTDVTDEYAVFNWIKTNRDGSSDTVWTQAHVDFGKAVTITPADFDDNAVFSYTAEIDGKVVNGGSTSVVKVYDGEDGKTPIKGVDYFDGKPGADGKTAYIHVRYSATATGANMTDDPANAKYMGTQVSQSPNASTVPSDYKWVLFQKEGIAGEPGADGQTSYLHIRYSDDGGKTFTANNGETAGAYIGQYVDFTQADSTDVTKYTWSKVKGEQGPKGDTGATGVPGTPGADGRTPYFHTAYAWSADRTDRFTPVYPGENLLPRSKFETMDGWSSNFNSYSLSNNEITLIKSAVFSSRAFLNVSNFLTSDKNKKYSAQLEIYISSDANNISGSTLFLRSFSSTGGAQDFSVAEIGDNAPKETWFRITTPPMMPPSSSDESKGLAYILAIAGNAIGTFKVRKPKAEVGSPTIYTPAPSEDYANAYPTYTGTYTDYTEADSTNPADYTWARILGEAGPQGPAGPKGDRGIMGVAYMQPTQPSDTTEGATWFKTESAMSDKIIGVYAYKSGWQPKKYASATLAVEELSAITANLGTVTAGEINGVTITGSTFINTGEVMSGTSTIEYTTTNMGTIYMEYNVKNSNQHGDFLIAPNGIYSQYYNDASFTNLGWYYGIDSAGLAVGDSRGTNANSASYGVRGITITDKLLNAQYGAVKLGFQDLMTITPKMLSAASGWTQYNTSPTSDNYPSARRNGRVVQLSGAFKNNAVIAAGADVVMGTVPVWARPAQNVNTIAQASSNNRYLLTVTTTGEIKMARHSADGTNLQVEAGAWLNVAIVYTARDL